MSAIYLGLDVLMIHRIVLFWTGMNSLVFTEIIISALVMKLDIVPTWTLYVCVINRPNKTYVADIIMYFM